MLSEVARPRPERRVIAWLDALDEDDAAISAITLAELARGAELLGAGKRQTELRSWIERELRSRFEGRVLPVDERVALAWSRRMAQARREGRALHAMDGFLAATADVHELTLVTRDVTPFAALGIAVLDPWRS